MKKIYDWLLTLRLFFHEAYIKHILKIRRKCSSIIFFKAYIEANFLFSDATLKENENLAHFVRLDVIDISHDMEIKNIKEERIEILRKKILSDESVTNALAQYFLLESFFYSYGNEDGHNKNFKAKGR